MDAVEFLEQWKRFRTNELNKHGLNIPQMELDLISSMIDSIDCIENWSKTHPVIELTEQQKTAIRGRIAEGYRWVVGWQFSDVVFSIEKPEQNENGGIGLRGRISYGDFLFFNFVKVNSIFYLPDLLGGEE